MSTEVDTTSDDPVFLFKKDIVNGREKFATTFEICQAVEATSGQGSIVGAQPNGGLWKIYPKSREVRQELLIRGFNLRNTHVIVHGSNPYKIKDDNGQVIPTTKVWIDDIPISVAASEIEFSMMRLGCEIRSKIIMERAKDCDGKMSRFLTGRRFVFITTPSTPLDKQMPVGDLYKAKIYHREQKQTKRSCTRCFSEEHSISQCTNEIVCRVCRVSGHRSGDEACAGAPASPFTDGAEGTGRATTNGRASGGSGDSAAGKEGDNGDSGTHVEQANGETASTATTAATTASEGSEGRGRRRSRESLRRQTGMAFRLIGERGKDRSSSKRRQSSSPGGATRSPKAARCMRGEKGKDKGKGKGLEQRKEEGEVYSTDEGEFEQGEDNLEDGAGEKWG